jgi:hypothetical protein
VRYARIMGYPLQWRADRGGTGSSLATPAKCNIGQLTALVKTRLRRMQYRPGLAVRLTIPD